MNILRIIHKVPSDARPFRAHKAERENVGHSNYSCKLFHFPFYAFRRLFSPDHSCVHSFPNYAQWKLSHDFFWIFPSLRLFRSIHFAFVSPAFGHRCRSEHLIFTDLSLGFSFARSLSLFRRFLFQSSLNSLLNIPHGLHFCHLEPFPGTYSLAD